MSAPNFHEDASLLASGPLGVSHDDQNMSSGHLTQIDGQGRSPDDLRGGLPRRVDSTPSSARDADSASGSPLDNTQGQGRGRGGGTGSNLSLPAAPLQAASTAHPGTAAAPAITYAAAATATDPSVTSIVAAAFATPAFTVPDVPSAAAPAPPTCTSAATASDHAATTSGHATSATTISAPLSATLAFPPNALVLEDRRQNKGIGGPMALGASGPQAPSVAESDSHRPPSPHLQPLLAPASHSSAAIKHESEATDNSAAVRPREAAGIIAPTPNPPGPESRSESAPISAGPPSSVAGDARWVFFASVKSFAKSAKLDADESFRRASEYLALLDCARLPAEASVDDIERRYQAIEAARNRKESAKKRCEWLDAVQDLSEPKPRAPLAFTPAWSFAGDLQETARKIEAFVSLTVPLGCGTKDDLKIVYVSNPPRHGKSLLLDNLFLSDSTVCVLTATYNAATRIPDGEYASVDSALRGLYCRLLHTLLPSHEDHSQFAYLHSPFANAEDPTRVFKDILGLRGNAPAKLLICIDEISKLLDDQRCTWAADRVERKKFWQGLYSITRATSNWVRIVMTGFTDTPSEAIASSDVACHPVHLSMLLGPEKERLAAELVWAYASANVVFPGLLWALVKSTPGLLGLWAEHIRLHRHENGACTFSGCDSRSTEVAVSSAAAAAAARALPPDSHPTGVKADVSKAEAILDLTSPCVPWVSVLSSNARQNWPLIAQFLIEEAGDNLTSSTKKAARTAELATALEGQHRQAQRSALSPFAVAITIMSLRTASAADALIHPSVFDFLNGALLACESHAAGCVKDSPTPWHVAVQKQLKALPATVKSSSLILRDETRLTPRAPDLPGEGAVSQGVAVHDAGAAYENFILHALALRLECLRLAVLGPLSCPISVGGRRSYAATQLLPPAVGKLLRPTLAPQVGTLTHLTIRHAVEHSIAVAVPREGQTTPELFLARLCTQTAALMLPSQVTMILKSCVTDTSIKGADLDTTGSQTDLAEVLFTYDSVAVVLDVALLPLNFPVLTLYHPSVTDPQKPHGMPIRQALLAELSAASLSGDLSSFDAANVLTAIHSATGVDLRADPGMLHLVADVIAVHKLALKAAQEHAAVLFKPSNPKNALCDTVAIIPCESRTSVAQPEGHKSVFFVLLEVRDRMKAGFGDKVAAARRSELLLAPVANLLAQQKIAVVGTAFVPVARALFRI